MNRIFVKLEKYPRFIQIIVLIIIYGALFFISFSFILFIINLIVYLIMGESFLD